jgi:hypothetical protein
MKRRHAQVKAVSEPPILALYTDAVSRKRKRLTYATEYTYSNLVAYLSSILPEGWEVHAPTTCTTLHSGLDFPVADASPAQHDKELIYLADFLGNIPVSEAEDQYNGHCETCAVCFTGEVVKLLCSNVKYQPSEILHAAYASLNEKLTNMSWEECVGEIFAAEQRARKYKKNEHMSPTKGRTVAMWEPLITHDVFAGENIPLCSSILGSGGVQDIDACHIMAFIAGSSDLASRTLSACSAVAALDHPVVMPLFILNCAYFFFFSCLMFNSLSLLLLLTTLFSCVDIFDGDELNSAELKCEKFETAQYSCHVVGLVMSVSKDAYIADPNGALLPGGNMEFLSLPLKECSDFRPTTKNSRYDRDIIVARQKKIKIEKVKAN